jgi:ubiquinone/menaquinone biosynthesis C-methylase UbiE
MGESRRTFVPAAGHDWLLPLYDPFVKLFGGDRARQMLLEQAALRARQRVLDIGCGTGTLVILIKRLHPDVEVVGIDPDPKALARARRKAARAAVDIDFDQGFADALPYPEASFDRVFSSFMFHHLEAGEKGKTLREVRRVLKPGGSLHLLDFGGPGSVGGGVLSRWVHLSHDNAEDRVLSLMREAELADPRTVGHGAMFLGHLAYAYYQASVPVPAAPP